MLEYIDFGGGELACGDALLEQQVQLGEGAALGLGQAEVGVDYAEEAGAGPEESGVVAPVPGAGVKHVYRGQLVCAKSE